MTDALLASYEQVPYESNPITVSHPARLAALGMLHGLHPAPVERCRVLELGCAGGGNLIPMALGLPNAEFVGIDLSPRQIDDGQKLVAELGLKNVRLSAASILDIDPSFGTFDYIICHGVYSWVPPNVRETILDVCRWTLRPDGLAYVSYNCYPGWHVRGSLRATMRYHSSKFADPKARVAQARFMLGLLGKAVEDKHAVISYMVREETERLAPLSDSYVYHEHLEEFNNPFYFHEFIAHLRPHGLQWVGEAKPSDPARLFSAEVVHQVEQFSADPIEREQYYDFLRDRLFRRSVICHANRQVRRPAQEWAIATMWCGAAAKPAAPTPDCKSSAPEKFISADETIVTIGNPILKTALVALFEARPRALHFDQLRATVSERLSADPAQIDEHLPAAMLQCHMTRFVELFAHVPALAAQPGERPTASKLARLQARHSDRVTNLWHRGIELDGMNRLLLRQLDGTKDRQQLVEHLLQQAQAGRFELKHEGAPITDRAQLQVTLSHFCELSLNSLAANGLLVDNGTV